MIQTVLSHTHSFFLSLSVSLGDGKRVSEREIEEVRKIPLSFFLSPFLCLSQIRFFEITTVNLFALTDNASNTMLLMLVVIM